MKAVLSQSVAVLLLSIPNFLAAIAITWPSYTGRILESASSPIGVVLTKKQVEMVASLPILGSLASVPAFQLPDLIGRRNTEAFSGIIITLSWSLVVTAHSVLQLYISRFLLGLGVGIHLMIYVVFVNEFAQVYIRGTLACVPIFFYSFGTLISYLMGWFCSYHFIVYLNLVFSVFFAVSVNFLKESPVFLVTKRKEKDALKALKFYRGTTKTSNDILEEFEYLKSQRESSSYGPDGNAEKGENIKLNNEKEEKNTKDMSAWQYLYHSKPTQRALLTVTSLSILSMMMGLTPILTYAGAFFKAAAPDISPDLCSVIMAVAIATGNALAVFITDLVPRRVLMMSSCTACALCLGALSSMQRWPWAPSWAVPLSMLLYTCAFTVGAGNLPMVQLSESFMPKVKVLASAVCMSSMFGTNYVVVSLFGPAADLIGLDGVFFFFFLATVVATAVTFFFMKETKGVPLEEIQEMNERGFLYWK